MSETMREKLQRYDNLIATLGIDEETDDAVMVALAELTDDIQAKAGACVSVINRMQNHINAVKDEKKRLNDYQKRLETAQERLKSTVLIAMRKAEIKTILTDVGELKRRKTKPLVIVDDVTAVPAEYMETKIEQKPNKNKIYDALKKGEKVAGCRLQENESLGV